MIKLNLATPAPTKRAEKRSGVPAGGSFGLTLGDLGRFLGAYGNDAGVVVDAITAQGVATVTACLQIISTAIGSLPFKVYRRVGESRVEVPEHPLHRLLTLEPNPHVVASSLFEHIVLSILTYGNSYVQVQRDSANDPVALWPLASFRTQMFLDKEQKLWMRTTDGEDLITPRVVPAADVVHVIQNPDLLCGGIVGRSVISMAPQIFAQALAADKYASLFFKNGGIPALAISLAEEVDAKTKALMREQWKELQTGAQQHSLAILDQGAKIEQFTVNPTDAALIPVMTFLAERIGGLFGVPAFMLGSSERLSQNSAEQIALMFVTSTLRPLAHKVTQELTRKLLPKDTDLYIEADFSQRLKGDLKSTLDAIAVGRQNGLFTINDGRKMLGLDPVSDAEGGNSLMVQVNMQNPARLADTESIQDQPVNSPAPEDNK